MNAVICGTTRRGTPCTQVLLKAGTDFTGTIQIKCPRCRTLITRRFKDGQYVA